MKKLIYGAAMAAIALFSACENIAPVEAVDADSEKVILTATLGNDTKTYLEWNGSVFKTRWAEDDEIYLLDLKEGWDDYARFDLVSGAGESTGQFELAYGSMPKNFIATYGEIEPMDGNWFVCFDYNQYRKLYYNNGKEIQGFDASEMPMIAEGNDTELYFKNLGSVLKLSVVGNGENLRSVAVKSQDDGVYLAGCALMTLDSSRPTYSFVEYETAGYTLPLYDEIIFHTDNQDSPAVLSSDPIECYIVIPSQTYPSGLSIQLLTDSGYMNVETSPNLVFSQSELREMPVLTYSSSVDFEGTWRVESDESSKVGLLTEREGDYLVLRDYYIDEYAYLNFYYGETKYAWSEKYENYTRQLTNTCGILQSYDSDEYRYIEIRTEGYYDIYLNPNTLETFIMSDGVSLSDIPTTDEVVCQNYNQLYNLEDGALVKIYGLVCAATSKGILVRLDGHSNPVLVYDNSLVGVTLGSDVELYATKTTYAGLPELVSVTWSRVYAFTGRYYESWYNDITSDFDNYNLEFYAQINFRGTLSISGNYYNIIVDNAVRQGSIQSPTIDLSAYNGKEVVVYGYYAGLTTSKAGQEYLNIILTKIATPDAGGSTEDVIPDDDLVGTEVIETK